MVIAPHFYLFTLYKALENIKCPTIVDISKEQKEAPRNQEAKVHHHPEPKLWMAMKLCVQDFASRTGPWDSNTRLRLTWLLYDLLVYITLPQGHQTGFSLLS